MLRFYIMLSNVSLWLRCSVHICPNFPPNIRYGRRVQEITERLEESGIGPNDNGPRLLLRGAGGMGVASAAAVSGADTVSGGGR